MRLVAAFLLLLLCGTAHAQNLPVYQTGLTTPGHVGVFVTPGVIQDDVLPSGDYLANTFGITATGLPFCINDAPRSSAGGYHQLCMGALATIGNTTGGFIAYTAYGGATAYGLSCIINGVTLPCFPSGGNVTGPTNPFPTAGDAVIWNGADTVRDGGAPPTLVVPSNAALQALSLTGIPSGTSVLRAAFYAGVPGQPTVYTLTSANCADADNGLEVQPTVGTGCWLGQMVTGSPSVWGSSGSNSQATCSMSASSTTMTLGAFSVGTNDFVNGEPVFCTGAGPTASATAPSLSVSAVNGSGTTTYYTLRAIDAGMGVAAAITPVSVSGGALLGNPQTLKVGGFTTTTHGTTTIDGITLPSGCATLAACVAVNDYVKKGDVTAGTYVTAVGATSITISAAATGSSASDTSFISPTFGISNNLTITGVPPGGIAIYKGTSSTLSAMTCIGWTDNALGIWRDYGQTETCPSWIPATADVVQNDVLRTTIVSGGGTSTLTVANAASNAVTGSAINIASHDDSNAIDNAVASSIPLIWNCGSYNQLYEAVIASSQVIDGKGCATIYSWGPVNNFVAGVGSSQHVVQNIDFYDAQKSSGFDLYANDSSRFLWQNVNSTSTFNFFYVTKSGNARMTNMYGGTDVLNGDYCMYFTGSRNAVPSTFVNNPTITNVTCGPGYNNYGLLADGDVNSLTMYESGFFASANEMTFQNTVGGAVGPNFGKFDAIGLNNAWGVAIKLLATSTGFQMAHVYDQGVQGNGNPGIYVSTNSSLAVSGNSSIFGFDKDGIENHGQLSVDNSTNIWGNNQYQGQAGGGFAKVELEADSGVANIQGSAGDQGAVPDEQYGILIDSGAGGSAGMGVSKWYPPIQITNYMPGFTCTINDQSGAYNIVQVNGQFGNSPTCEVANNASPPTAGTFTTADMLGTYQTSNIHTVQVSGNVLNTGVTWTTPTAAAIVTAYKPTAVANLSMFNFQVQNLGSSIVTIAGGTGVTISGTSSVLAATTELYRCIITNIGSGTQAATCTGVI